VRAHPRPAVVAARVVDLVLALHRRWRGLRSSVLALVGSDPTARRFYREQRHRQLHLLAELRGVHGGPARSAAEDAVLLYALERTCDAVANGELRALGVGLAPTVRVLRTLVYRQLVRD